MSGTASELDLSGRLREVIAYENQTTGGFFRVEVRTHLLSGREFPSYDMCSSMFVTKVLCIFSVGYADRDHKRSENSSSRRIEKH